MSARKRRPCKRSRLRQSFFSFLSEEDLPLAFLARSVTPKRAKKTTTSRRTERRTQARASAMETIVLDDTVMQDSDMPDVCSPSSVINAVNTKVDTFLESGGFISSDGEEEEMLRTKTNKKPSPNQFFISDDSDDEIKIVSNSGDQNNSRPSTSAGPSASPCTSTAVHNEDLESDIISIIDSVLEKDCIDSVQTNTTNAMKSLEDFRKETEEMLKNATSLLDEIKTGRKPEEEVKKDEDSPGGASIGSCPVCFEPLMKQKIMVTMCGHMFCAPCLKHVAQTMKKCPICRKVINLKKIHPLHL